FTGVQPKQNVQTDVIDKIFNSEKKHGLPGVSAQQKAYIGNAIQSLKNAGDIFNRRLEFEVDDKTNMIVVKVIDTRTDKVIKEIPPEQIVRLAQKIQEMIGLLVDEQR
ncbi:MAG: flagellar protein FlaG, partial [Spirochaetota bacterium]